MSNCGLGPKSIAIVASTLATGVAEVDISDNSIWGPKGKSAPDTSGWVALRATLEALTTIKALNLSKCRILTLQVVEEITSSGP